MKKQLGLALAAGLATSAVLVGTGGSASATDNNLVTLGFTSSNNAASATGVTYTWSLSVPAGTSAVVDKILLTLPTGASGTPTNPVIYGLPTGCSSAFNSSGTTITLTGAASACQLPAPSTLAISLSGFTNPAAGSVTTRAELDNATPTDIADGSTTVAIAPTSTSVSVLVPESLTFTNTRTDIQMMAIPGGNQVDAPEVDLTVATNAADGYKLNGCVTTAHQLTFTTSTATTKPTIPQANTTTAALLDKDANPGFGASATLTASSGSSATLTAPWTDTTGGKVLGYDALCTNTSAQIASSTGPTNGDTLSLVNSVKLAGTQPGGLYTGEIDYTVTPKY